MLQSPQLVRHCACVIRHETLIKFIIIITVAKRFVGETTNEKLM